MASNLKALSQSIQRERTAPANPRGTCPRGHDMTLPGARKLTHKGDGRYYWLCMACRSIRREQDRARRRERRALKAGESLADELPPIALDQSPFAVTQRALEAHWGIPADRWTPQHHRVHTRAIYRLLGWPADGPPRANAASAATTKHPRSA